MWHSIKIQCALEKKMYINRECKETHWLKILISVVK